jgi:hypothetical protein
VTGLAFEPNVFTVAAAVKLVRADDDGDLHLVLRSGDDHCLWQLVRLARA